MPIQADEYAVAGSGFFPVAAYQDEDGNAVTPSAASWSLYDENQAVVNSRQDVAIASPTTSDTIQLGPDDTALNDSEAESETRFLVVTFTYTSSLGSGLTGKAALEFKVVSPNPKRS